MGKVKAMNVKDVIKTGISLFIDFMIYGFIAFFVAAAVGGVLTFLFDFDVVISRATVGIVGIIVFIILMYWNYKYRYKKDSIEETESERAEEEYEQIKKDE